MKHDPVPRMAQLMNEGAPFLNLCPASIYLLGSGVNCSQPEGHDGMHQVTIQWTVGQAAAAAAYERGYAQAIADKRET